MTDKLFIGVDGGATKCIVRVEDEGGRLIGQATSGPASLRLSIEEAWASINKALRQILPQINSEQELHAGMGLAGCESPDVLQAFLEYSHPFHSLHVVSDAHTGCLGAHGGQDGAIIVIGTGIVGMKCERGQVTAKVGGWGFPCDDLGSGAWLGWEAVRIAIQTMDGRLPNTIFSDRLIQHFGDKEEDLVNWVYGANSTRFAELAPLVIALGQQGDATAMRLMQSGAREIERVMDALDLGALPLSLIGGVVPHIAAYFADAVRSRIRPAIAPPEVGAIMLARMRHRDHQFSDREEAENLKDLKHA